MPQGKKQKQKKSTQPKQSKTVRGFGERVVKNTPPHLLGTLADIAENVLPLTPFAPFGKLVKPLRSVLGFDERVVHNLPQASSSGAPGVSSDGGTVVQTMNAPIAFARNQLKTGYHAIQVGPDAQRMWVCDLWSLITTNISAQTFNSAKQRLFPMNNTLFSNFYVQFEDWERWRPLFCRLHFVHFANTSEVASVVLAANSDPNSSEAAAVYGSFTQMGSLERSAIGNAYEDLGLDVHFPAWDQGTWLFNDNSEGTDERLNDAGYVGWGTEQNVNTSKSLGYCYVELLFDVCGRRKPYLGVGLYSRLARGLSSIPEDLVSDYRSWAIQQIAEQFSKDTALISSKKEPLGVVGEFLAQNSGARSSPVVGTRVLASAKLTK